MDSAAGDLDYILRIPPTSPSRRDYGIRSPARSPSPVRFEVPSSPQSPWLPRGDSPPSREVEKFRRYESNPPPLVLDRGSYYSGPLPAAPERSSLPSFSGPLPGFATATTESFEFSTWARIYHMQHANDSNSIPGSPEAGSSRDSSFRKEGDDSEPAKEEVTSTFHLAASPPPRFSARAGMHGRVGSVSGELGRSDDVVKQKSLVTRGYKSGEIDIAAAYAVDIVRQQRWESLNKDTSPNCDAEPMVTIPFKWDEASSRSRNSSKASSRIGAGIGDFSFGSNLTKSESEKAESVQGSEASVSVTSKPVKASSAPPVKSTPKKAAVVRSAVPFKWEDAPGKPKFEERLQSTEKTPALQLPPRLASATVKRTNWGTGTSSSTTRSRSSSSIRSRPIKAQSRSSLDSSSSKPSRQSQPKPSRKPSPQPSPQPSRQPSPQPPSSPRPQEVAQTRHTLGPNFLSGPLDNTAKPTPIVPSTTSKSGPISPLGLPQHDFFSVRSPTSTLQGPGSISSDGHSNTSENYSRKSPSVTCSHSGTSAESLEHWSDPDHAFESPGAVHGHNSFEPETSTMRRKKPSSSSKSKPPMSPITHSPASAGSDFDKTPVVEDRREPPTRLPYKMPETNTCQEIVVKVEDARRGRSNSRCFELPRFRNKSSGPVLEADPSWDAPSRCLEDGYRSPTYRATLEMLSPSPSPTPAKVKLGSASPRRLVEGICNSLKLSFHKLSKRNGGQSNATAEDDPFMKRHPSLGL